MSKFFTKIKQQEEGAKEMIALFIAIILTSTITGLYLGYVTTKSSAEKEQTASLSNTDALGYFKDNIVSMFKDSFAGKTDAMKIGMTAVSGTLSGATTTIESSNTESQLVESQAVDDKPIIEQVNEEVENSEFPEASITN